MGLVTRLGNQLATLGDRLIRADAKSAPTRLESARVSRTIRTIANIIITPDTAVTIPAVWACLRYLSQNVAMLPWRVYSDGPDGRKLATTHVWDYRLHKRPSLEWSSFQLRETLLHWALRWGNGYAEIEFDQAGRPFALWPIHPERVTLNRNTKNGRLFYEVDGNENWRFDSNEIFHLRGFGEGPLGVNVITYAAESLGWAKAAQLFGSSFFGNGLNPSAVIKLAEAESPAAMVERRKAIDATYRGVRNSSKYLMLDKDDSYEAFSVAPEQAQFIATNQHLVEDVCRWFGVPPHKIMHLLRATFSNIEHQAIEVVVDSLHPWAQRFEDEADFKLFGENRGGFYTKMNFNALLRGDSAARASYYRTMRELGSYSVNEIRELEDENRIGPEGDKRVMQSQFTTLEKVGEAPTNQGTSPSQPSQPSESSALEKRDPENARALRNLSMSRGLIHVR